MRPCLGKIWRRQNNHFCFFCIEFEKVGLHPNLNFRYTFLYWAKAGIIILTKWNIELCIICITVELHTKFSQNVTERKKICGKQHWAQYLEIFICALEGHQSVKWWLVISWSWSRYLNQLEQLECLTPPPSTPPPPGLPIPVIHRSQVETRQSQSYKFKKFATNSNLEILPETLHVTHPLKLLDKM